MCPTSTVTSFFSWNAGAPFESILFWNISEHCLKGLSGRIKICKTPKGPPYEVSRHCRTNFSTKTVIFFRRCHTETFSKKWHPLQRNNIGSSIINSQMKIQFFSVLIAYIFLRNCLTLVQIFLSMIFLPNSNRKRELWHKTASRIVNHAGTWGIYLAEAHGPWFTNFLCYPSL